MARFIAGFTFAVVLLSSSAAIAQSQTQGLTLTDKVFIAGAVNKPGVYLLMPAMTVVDLIDLAGGLLPSAGDRIVLVSGTQKDERGQPAKSEFSFQELKSRKVGKQLPELKIGDQLIIPGR